MYTKVDSSRLLARQALRLSKTGHSDVGIASAYQRLGITYQVQGDYDSAKFFSEQSLQMWKKQDNQDEEARTLNNIGIIYDEQGLDDQALEYYIESLRIYESRDDKGGMAKVYNNLGIINKKNGRYDQVIYYYDKSLAIYRKLEHAFGIAATLGNMGSAFLETKEYDQAITYSEEAIERYEEAGIDQYVPYSLENIGLAYQGKGELSKATSFHLRALLLYEKFDNKKESAFTLASLADIKLLQNKYDSAHLLAMRSLHLATDIGAQQEIKRANRLLVETNIHLGHPSAALIAFGQYIQHSDSLNSKQRAEALADVQTKYETEKKEQAIKTLEDEALLKDVKLQRNAYFIGVILLLSFGVGFLMLLNFKRKNYKLRAVHSEEKERIQKNRFRAVIEAQEMERKRIAQELHDGLGQLLSVVRLNVSSLDEDEKDMRIQKSIGLVDSAVSEVRSISHNMMPTALANIGLLAALRDLQRQLNDSSKVKTEFLLPADLDLPENHSIGLYRISQELINNALKYAESSEIKLSLSTNLQETILEICDDGKGFETERLNHSDGIGWQNIRSRVDVMDGEIHIYSKLGTGTTVRIQVPNERKNKTAAS